MDPPGMSQDSEEYAERLRRSPFHNRRQWAGPPTDYVWFTKYRLMLNYTYLQLTRLGLLPAQRFLLCHLAANAAEEMYRVSAVDVPFPSVGDPVDPRELSLRGAQ